MCGEKGLTDLCFPPLSESDDDERPGDVGNGDAGDDGGDDGAGGDAGAGDGAGSGDSGPSKDGGEGHTDGNAEHEIDPALYNKLTVDPDQTAPSRKVLASKSGMLHRYDSQPRSGAANGKFEFGMVQARR